ncbi:MAG TPA: anaerobic ribonucleoside-triphosphate reductase activating protein [Bacilli bacterium]|nr:anaerobic ribonucleoside-triphosphate reductase activating protein [Bacilli bacterium]
MQISGLVKNSFVDFPGHLAAVIFTPFCNYDCFYCHNRELIENPQQFIDENEVLDFLQKRRGMLEGVVISGGEPTLQKDLERFIIKVKNIGFLVKLDSNGSNPNVIEGLLKKNLLDYVAIDYKAPSKKYKEICGKNADSKDVLNTINILKKSNVDFQVRTTLCPTLTKEDMKSLKQEIGNVKNYVINKYRIPEKYKKEDEDRIREKAIDKEILG